MLFKTQHSDFVKTLTDKLSDYDRSLQLHLLTILKDLSDEEAVYVPISFYADHLHKEYFVLQVISLVEDTSLFARKHIECHINSEPEIHTERNLSLELAFSQVLFGGFLMPLDKYFVYAALLEHEARHPAHKQSENKETLLNLHTAVIAVGKRYSKGLTRRINSKDAARLRAVFASAEAHKQPNAANSDTRDKQIEQIKFEAAQELEGLELSLARIVCR